MKTLETLTRDEALGVLANAALNLPYAGVRVTSLEDKQTEVIQEARDILGVDAEDISDESLRKIADYLDEQSERLLSVPESEALQRLSEGGGLPSDLYEINIIPTVREVYGKAIDLEVEVITLTIKEPQSEQHFGGRSAESSRLPAISLFLRYFNTTWPLKNFYMLVAGQREGLKLDVSQAWRVYPESVNINKATSPLHVLERFADRYGAEITMDGKTAKFFFIASGDIPESFSWKPEKHRDRIIKVSRFYTFDQISGKKKSALVLAIDVDMYHRNLRENQVKRADIKDLVNRPKRVSATASIVPVANT